MEAPAIPCGLIAKSMFNDTYSMKEKTSGNAITIDESDIAWETDVKHKFKNI